LVVAGVLLFQRFYQGVVAEVEFEEPVFVAGQPGRVDCCFSALLLDLALVIAAVYFEGGFEFLVTVIRLKLKLDKKGLILKD
jgi:hypothetical protein